MRSVDALPLPWVVSWLFLLCCGMSATLFGKRLPRRGDWLVALGGLTLLIATGGMGAEISDPSLGPSQWLRGWFAPQDGGAVMIGAVFDSLGTGMGLWALFLLCLCLVALSLSWQEPRAERLGGGAAIAAAGSVLSWHSSTPWSALAGLGLAVLGAWTTAGSRWEQVREADGVARLLSERAWGLLLSGLGAAILAGANPSLGLLTGEPLTEAGRAGAWVLAVGLWVFLTPFPLQGSLSANSELSMPFRVFSQHLMPAAAALAVFVRWSDPFRSAGVMEPLGWMAAFSAATSFLFSLFSASWKPALLGWLSASLSVALALVAFLGPRAGIASLVAGGAASVVMALIGSFLDSGSASEVKGAGTAPTLRTFALITAFFGSGGVASLTVGSWIGWFGRASNDPLQVAAVALLAASVGLCLWRVGWKIKNGPGAGRPTSAAQLSIAVVALIAMMGVWWEGSLTGGLAGADGDRVLPSWIASAAPNLAAAYGMGGDSAAIVLYFLSWFTGLGIAYGTVGRREDLWSGWSARWSGGTRFISGGYGFDRLGDFWMRVCDASGRWLSTHSERAWAKWIPSAASAAIEGVSVAYSKAERWALDRVGYGLRQAVVLSSQLVRLNQTGDVRWYVFFSVGVGILLLLALMR